MHKKQAIFSLLHLTFGVLNIQKWIAPGEFSYE